ncbi:lantibiotic dehydratase [Bacillus atrophaeus]|uniref:lantibiotic dehydratase n=1 Tax=Bacillus atrophaeus TaxID=1452 RepID=UPI002E1B5BE4|nr:lantibiotic dehydratase [Bacillus atrophaeus]MED4858031.1 lantibiotic dehydratase [Bacillus atrophaeus]
MAENVAPFVMLRAAGGSIDSLKSMDIAESAKNVDKILDLEQALENLKEPLSDIFYELISRLQDEETTILRFLLKIKRDIFNSRAVKISEENRTELKKRMSEADFGLFDQWYTAIHDRQTYMEDTKQLFEEEIKQAGKRLAYEMENKEWQKGMALANPKYLTAYKKSKPKLWQPHKQYARSSMAYLGRITAKTSPFSTFTKIGLTSFSADDAPAPSTQKTNFCSISKSICSELIFEMAQHPEFSRYLQYEKNQSLQPAEKNTIQLMKSSYTILNGFAWREDKMVSENVSDEQMSVIESLCSGGFEEVTELLKNTSLTIPCLSAEQWIKPVLPFSRKSEQPLLSLYVFLQPIPSRKARRLARIVKWMDGCIEALAASEAKRRLKYHQLIHRLAKRAFSELTHKAPKSLLNEKLVYENVKFAGDHPPLGEYVKRDMEKLSHQLRNYQFRTHLYDLLCEHFVETYGRGGLCSDIQAFLYQFEKRKDRPRLIKNALRKDKKTALKLEESRVFAPYGASSAPPSATVFYQLAANNGRDSIAAGDYQLVINQISSGLGLLLRFQSMFQEDGRNLSTLMKQWVNAMNPSSDIVHFPMISDFSNLQTDPGITSQSLRWLGENPTSDQNDILLKDLLLVHEDSGTLALVNKEGRPVAPMYFGAVPQHMMHGPVSYLFTIMMPWINAYQADWVSSPLFSKAPPPEKVEFHSRVQEGRIVQRRSRWRIPAFLFPLKEHRESEYAYFTRMKAFQKNYGLPDEGFLSGERTSVMLNPKQRKPMYMNFNSYHSIEAAVNTVAAEDDLLSITFTEALPDRNQHWLKSEEGHVIASEYMSLFQWPGVKHEESVIANQKGVFI